jgi:hypothetical protein
VANDLEVKLSGAPQDDSDIARAIAHVLEWNVQVPDGKVHAGVSDGWVTLEGEVRGGANSKTGGCEGPAWR